VVVATGKQEGKITRRLLEHGKRARLLARPTTLKALMRIKGLAD
jgi:hypothetical protein